MAQGVAAVGEGENLSTVSLWKRRPATRWPSEIGAVGVAAAVWAGGEYVRLRRAPAPGLEKEAQRVLNRLDGTARRRLLRPQTAPTADRTSDALAYAAVPLACGLALLCVDDFRPRLVRDALRIARAATLTGAVNQGVKFLAPRERPFARGIPGAIGRDRYGSFFSNHTSAVTSMAASTTRLLRARGASGWLGIPLFGLALFVGYLRIAADRHYLTDVLAGAAFGSVIGYVAAR